MDVENYPGPDTWTGQNENFRLSVSRAEIDGRREALLEKMREAGVDCAVFTTPETIFYLTGVSLARISYNPLVLSVTGEHRLLCRNIDMGWHQVWEPQSWASDWVAFKDHEDPIEIVAEAVRSIKPKNVAKPAIAFELERASISYSGVTRIAELAQARLIASCAVMADELRAIKSPAELKLMRRAGKISATVSDTVIEALRSGATDAEASVAAGKVVNELSGTPRPAPTVMTGALGGNGHMVAWTKRRPEEGDPVTWYVSGFVHNYACPLERTIVRGKDKHGILPMVDAVGRAVERLVAELRPGMTSSQAYEICLRSHQESGVAQYWKNHAGYGTGINWVEFELFRIRQNDSRILRPGMALHLVPCLTIPGLTNVQGSRVIAITEDGVEELSNYPIRIPSFG